MVEWTTSARAELERYCALVRPQLETAGADAAEVEDDLRRHIDEEALAGRLKAITEDDVRRILARVGTPNLPREPNATPSREADSARKQASSPSPKPLGLGVLFFGGDRAAFANLPTRLESLILVVTTILPDGFT